MQRRQLVLFVLTGLFIIATAVVFVGPSHVADTILRLSALDFGILLLIQLGIMFLWAVKWRLVLRNTNVSFRNVLPVSLIGYMANNFTPIGLAGGEPVRAYLLARLEGVSTSKTAASVIVDLFLDFIPLLALIPLAVYLAFNYSVPPIIAIVLILMGLTAIAALTLVILLIVREEWSVKFIMFMLNLGCRIPVGFIKKHALDARKRVDKVIKVFKDAMHDTLTDKKIMAGGMALSTLIWAANILRLFLIFKMMNVDIKLPVVVIVRATVTAVSFASIIPGALGVWESASAVLFNMFGYPPHVGLTAALIERFYHYWIGSLIGVIAAAYLGVTHLIDKDFDAEDLKNMPLNK